MNYFSARAGAQAYALGRPDFHALVVERIRRMLQLRGRMAHALDVACGTGLSTKALLRLALRVTGTDVAAEMLQLAPLHPDIDYVQAPAEHQPFPDCQTDLITVCSGVHWFDIDAFLREAWRLLRPGGWLILYDNGLGHPATQSEPFLHWYSAVYGERFPAPPRNNAYAWEADRLAGLPWRVSAHDTFQNPVSFRLPDLAHYLLSQSNISAAVRRGTDNYDTAERWLSQELRAFYPAGPNTQDFIFDNWIRFIPKPLPTA